MHGCFRCPATTQPRYFLRLGGPLIEAEATRAPVSVQAAVVFCCGVVARQGRMNHDQFHVLATVDVGGQHAAQLRILGWSPASGAV